MTNIDSSNPACPTEKKTSGHRHRIQTLSVALNLGLATLCHAGQRPNILLMVADDIGYEALEAYGGLDFETPGLDRMAAQGMRFTRAYTSPACTPSRVSLHTSLYTTEHGQTTTLPVHVGRNAAVDFGAMPTFAQLLRARGYQTSTTGKWQLATLSFHPNHIADAGFDSWCVWQIWNGTAKTKRYWKPYINRDGAVLDDIAERFGPDVLEQYVWERMATARDANEPFLIVHNMLLPHEPITETPRDRELGRAASLGHMIEYLDHLVGRTLDKVEELGIRDNTYVFFIGDNGTEARHFNPRHTRAGDVHGGKRDLTDAGTHVPLLVWGPPGLGPGRVVSDLIDITDLFPTVCELTETAIPETISCRGISFVPQLQGRRGTPRGWVHHGFRNGVAVSDGQWRLNNSGALRDSRKLPAEPVATPGAEADVARTRLNALLDADPGEPTAMPAAWEAPHLPGLFYYRTPEEREARVLECDVVAYGGTPASFAATLQAARMGKRAMLVSQNGFVGGLTSGGLTAVDWGAKNTIGGISREFFGRARGLNPAVAESTFLKMLSEGNVKVLLNRFLKSVDMKDGQLVSITLGTGETIRAKVFVDGTYEGDLMAAANVSYTVGREPRSAYRESLGGQWQQVSWRGVYQFCGLPISPYVKPDDPKSGLLPEISSDPYGKPGDGDNRVQAYNFRMHLSNRPGKIDFPKPKGYDPDRYALLARFLNFDPRPRWTLNYTTGKMTDGPVQMRNGDSNNAGSFSSDYVGGSHRWPDGTFEPVNFSDLPPPRRGLPVPLRELYELREKIFQEHVTYQQGLLYFLANDKQVPEGLQARVNAWGLSPNQFKTTGHWPHQLYVREGRRMVSDYVMTQDNCQKKRVAEDSVGIASYAMDSHFCQRVVVQENGKTTVRNEGGFGHSVKPYPVSYRSIVPRKAECTNLLVPLCLSASHVAYGSIRMEPVFMILGQSAGTAAAISIDDAAAVQDVDYEKLKERLIADNQRL